MSDERGKTQVKKKKIRKICVKNVVRSKICCCELRVLSSLTDKLWFFLSAETLRHENDQLTSKTAIIEAENASLKHSVAELQNNVETASADVIRLTNQIAQQETELIVYRKERNDLVRFSSNIHISMDATEIRFFFFIDRLMSETCC